MSQQLPSNQSSLYRRPWKSFVVGSWKILPVVLLLALSLLTVGQGTAHAATHRATDSGTVWNVIMNSSRNDLYYNNYHLADPANTHFMIVNVSFVNQTSETQVLNSSQLYLIDSNGTHYYEDQSSAPWASYPVDPGQTIQTDTAYVIPNTICKYELMFFDPSGQTSSWTIQSSMCSNTSAPSD